MFHDEFSLSRFGDQKRPERRDELLGLFDKWEMTTLRDEDELGPRDLLVQILGGGELFR